MLSPGTRLGPYEILSALGAGGMGEVYRARDGKLNRDVAIKVLLPAVANDPDRLARFSREAQVLASLNHPNIAQIHGLEESGGVTALVMELVEGEDLSQRISRGAIPIDEALPIARQIAEALEAAHDHGIIHRDLKPANIKVRRVWRSEQNADDEHLAAQPASDQNERQHRHEAFCVIIGAFVANDESGIETEADRHAAWLARSEARWREAHRIASANPDLDPGDVYHALNCLELEPAERLRRGLTRVRPRPHHR